MNAAGKITRFHDIVAETGDMVPCIVVGKFVSKGILFAVRGRIDIGALQLVSVFKDIIHTFGERNILVCNVQRRGVHRGAGAGVDRFCQSLLQSVLFGTKLGILQGAVILGQLIVGIGHSDRNLDLFQQLRGIIVADLAGFAVDHLADLAIFDNELAVSGIAVQQTGQLVGRQILDLCIGVLIRLVVNDLIGLAAVLHSDDLVTGSIGALGFVRLLKQLIQIHMEGVAVLVCKGQRLICFVGQHHVILLHVGGSRVLALFDIHIQDRIHSAGGLVAGHGDVHGLLSGRGTDGLGQGVAAVIVLGLGVIRFQKFGKVFTGHLKVSVFRVLGQGVGLAVAVLFHAAHGIAVERDVAGGVPLQFFLIIRAQLLLQVNLFAIGHKNLLGVCGNCAGGCVGCSLISSVRSLVAVGHRTVRVDSAVYQLFRVRAGGCDGSFLFGALLLGGSADDLALGVLDRFGDVRIGSFDVLAFLGGLACFRSFSRTLGILAFSGSLARSGFGALIHLLLDDITGGFLRFDGAVLIIGELAVGVLDIGRDFLVLSLPVLQNALGVFVLLVFYGSSVCTFRSLLCRSFCFGTFFVLYRDCVFRGLSVGGQRGGCHTGGQGQSHCGFFEFLVRHKIRSFRSAHKRYHKTYLFVDKCPH